MLANKLILQKALLTKTGLRAFSISSVRDAVSHLNGLDTEGDNDHAAISDFCRDNFRKIEVTEALDLLEAAHKVKSLDSEWWVWATIEEAVRPKIGDLPEDQYDTIKKGFGETFKGSEDLWREIERREDSQFGIF